jgi:alkylation response protein AidB-like acyl-CoA dehydrogenase
VTIGTRDFAQRGTDEWLQVVQALAPAIRAQRDTAERERTLSRALVEQFQAAGLYSLKLPCAYGGAEVSHPTFFAIVEALSRIDAASGWLVHVGNEMIASAGYLPKSAGERIFGQADKPLVLAGAVNSRPGTRAEPVPGGGFTVTGQWSLASGAPVASWFAAAAMIVTEDGPRKTPQGIPEVHYFLIPPGDWRVVDTWDSLGLKASGSHDVAVDGAFVPDDAHFLIVATDSPFDTPLWRGRYPTHLGGIGSVALGVARTAIDEFLNLAGEKVPSLTATPLSERATIHQSIGRAEALVRASRTYMYAALEAIWQTELRDGTPPTPQQMADLRLAVVHAVQSSAEAVELMYRAAGATAVYHSSPLESAMRDSLVLTQHMAGSTMRYEQAGRFFVGLEPGPR